MQLFKQCALFEKEILNIFIMVHLHLSLWHPETDVGIILWLSPTLFPASFTRHTGLWLSWKTMLTKNTLIPVPSYSPSTLCSAPASVSRDVSWIQGKYIKATKSVVLGGGSSTVVWWLAKFSLSLFNFQVQSMHLQHCVFPQFDRKQSRIKSGPARGKVRGSQK